MFHLGMQCIMITRSVCLSVCLLISKTTRHIFTKFCLRVVRGRPVTTIKLCYV